jgi:hypothetical protein
MEAAQLLDAGALHREADYAAAAHQDYDAAAAIVRERGVRDPVVELETLLAGDAPDATRATALVKEVPRLDLRLAVEILGAERAADCTTARARLAPVLRDSARQHLVAVELAARLAAGQVALRCGDPRAGRDPLAALANRAQQHGFFRLARLARAAR